MNRAFEFLLATDQRIDFSLRGALGQIDCVGLERFRGRNFSIAVFFTATAFGFMFAFSFFGTAGVFFLLCDFRNAMRNKIDYIEARDVLLLEEKISRRFGLMKHRNQDIAAIDFVAARRLHMKRGTLQRALHADRIARHHSLAFRHPLDLLVKVARELLLQLFEVRARVLQDVAGGDVMQHRVQQMFQADVLVASIHGLGHGKLQGHLQLAAEHDIS